MSAKNEEELTTFQSAWLEAIAREEAKKGKGRRNLSSQVNRPPRMSPTLGKKPHIGYRREAAAEEASKIERELALLSERPVAVRKKTVRIQPHGVAIAQLRAKESLDKLRYQVGKLGTMFSRWVNDARPGGWRSLDSRLAQEWVNLMVATCDLEESDRTGVLREAATGMGLTNAFISRETPSESNKISFVLKILTSDEERHLAVGLQGIPVGGGHINSGAFFLLAFSKLTGLDRKLDLASDLRAFVINRCIESGELYDLSSVCEALSAWMIRPNVTSALRPRS